MNRKIPRSTSGPSVIAGFARPIYRTLRVIAFALVITMHKSHRRYALRWVFSMRPGYLLRKPSPWITFGAIEHLESQPLKESKIFEYGSGGSTFYWVKRGARCVSVEHDALWYEKVKSGLAGVDHLEYRLVPPVPVRESESSGRPDDPGAYLSSNHDFEGHSFRSYASQIDTFPIEYFDVILVDGRARPSCIRHSMSRLKPGGMLIVDNSDRPNYQRAIGELAGYSRMSFRGGVPQLAGWGQTDIFIKNK